MKTLRHIIGSIIVLLVLAGSAWADCVTVQWSCSNCLYYCCPGGTMCTGIPMEFERDTWSLRCRSTYTNCAGGWPCQEIDIVTQGTNCSGFFTVVDDQLCCKIFL